MYMQSKDKIRHKSHDRSLGTETLGALSRAATFRLNNNGKDGLNFHRVSKGSSVLAHRHIPCLTDIILTSHR
jgi:hypothetical protein